MLRNIHQGKRVPNIDLLDQSSHWRINKQMDGRVTISTTKWSYYDAEDALKFAILTFENAGFVLEGGEITPKSRNQVLLRATFKPGGDT